MGLVSAKCTQCDANIEIDDTKEAGICQYCGTAFVTEKAINNYKTSVADNDISGNSNNVIEVNIDNLIKLAEHAIEAKNGEEVIYYANRALEINPESSKAWLLKMQAMDFVCKIGNLQVGESISYGNNAIKYAENKESTISQVYNFYINRAIVLMDISASGLKDVTRIKQSLSINESARQGVIMVDTDTRNMYINLSVQALSLKQQIDEQYIKKNEDMQENIVTLAKLYIDMCEADVERISLYGLYLTSEAIEARQNTLREIKRGLPEERLCEINDERVKKNNYICVSPLIKCPKCDHKMSATANRCLSCGYKIRKPVSKKVTYAICIVVAIIELIFLVCNTKY